MSEISLKAIQELPETFVSRTNLSLQVSRAVKAGKLRKLASRLYTRNLTDPPEAIVKRHLWSIVVGFFPGALIADRTALENVPAEDGSIFLIAEQKRDVHLPGLVIRPRQGHEPLPSDKPFIDSLFLSSTARAYLENMRPSRAREGRVSRTLPRGQIEERLDTFLRLRDEEHLNKLRDEIHQVAAMLDMKKESAKLDAIIGTLLGTKKVELKAPLARARQKGRPYDPERMKLFELLHATLRDYPPVFRFAPKRSATEKAALAFYEAYFSNFIEGTEFEVEEAANIIFRGVIPPERLADAHDILGTWRIVSDENETRRVPKDFGEFVQLLKLRHFTIMEAHADMRPGEFKLLGNRAGNTVFVAPELVNGTLEQAFQFYRSLETPFQRAVYMMFLVSEVHPFADGNGRTARIMMNAEVVAAGEERMIIPTVYRANYLSALKALTQSRHPLPLIRVLDYAQKWTRAVNWQSVEETRHELEQCDAFLRAEEAEEQGKRLRMPPADR